MDVAHTKGNVSELNFISLIFFIFNSLSNVQCVARCLIFVWLTPGHHLYACSRYSIVDISIFSSSDSFFCSRFSSSESDCETTYSATSNSIAGRVQVLFQPSPFPIAQLALPPARGKQIFRVQIQNCRAECLHWMQRVFFVHHITLITS